MFKKQKAAPFDAELCLLVQTQLSFFPADSLVARLHSLVSATNSQKHFLSEVPRDHTGRGLRWPHHFPCPHYDLSRLTGAPPPTSPPFPGDSAP